MTVLKIIKEIESNLCGLDNDGNLRLDTKGSMAGQIADADVPQFGGKGIPTQVAISNAAGTSNISNVTFQVTDIDGTAVSGNFLLDILLSDATTGLGITGTTPSGGIAAAASGGEVELVMTVSKAVRMQTAAGGKAVLAITDSAKHAYVPVAYYLGRSFIGAALTTGSFGA